MQIILLHLHHLISCSGAAQPIRLRGYVGEYIEPTWHVLVKGSLN